MFFPRWRASAALLTLIAGSVQAQSVDADSLWALAGVEYALGHRDSALARFQEAMEANSSHAPSAMGIGRIALEKGNRAAAESLFTLAEEWAPDEGYREFGEGLIAERSGDNKLAMWKYYRASRMDGPRGDALVQNARLFAARGDRSEARQAYRDALEANSRHPSRASHAGKRALPRGETTLRASTRSNRGMGRRASDRCGDKLCRGPAVRVGRRDVCQSFRSHAAKASDSV